MTSLTPAAFKTFLLTKAQQEDSALTMEVAKIILDYEEPLAFAWDVISYGCMNGTVSALTYYADTHAFFDRHYDEIEDLRLQYEADFEQPLQITGDLKNFLSWYAFEEINLRLLEEAGG